MGNSLTTNERFPSWLPTFTAALTGAVSGDPIRTLQTLESIQMERERAKAAAEEAEWRRRLTEEQFQLQKSMWERQLQAEEDWRNFQKNLQGVTFIQSFYNLLNPKYSSELDLTQFVKDGQIDITNLLSKVGEIAKNIKEKGPVKFELDPNKPPSFSPMGLIIENIETKNGKIYVTGREPLFTDQRLIAENIGKLSPYLSSDALSKWIGNLQPTIEEIVEKTRKAMEKLGLKDPRATATALYPQLGPYLYMPETLRAQEYLARIQQVQREAEEVPEITLTIGWVKPGRRTDVGFHSHVTQTISKLTGPQAGLYIDQGASIVLGMIQDLNTIDMLPNLPTETKEKVKATYAQMANSLTQAINPVMRKEITKRAINLVLGDLQKKGDFGKLLINVDKVLEQATTVSPLVFLQNVLPPLETIGVIYHEFGSIENLRKNLEARNKLNNVEKARLIEIEQQIKEAARTKDPGESLRLTIKAGQALKDFILQKYGGTRYQK